MPKQKPKSRRKKLPKRVLALPDLEQVKSMRFRYMLPMLS
jgi:hypothetical protein